MDRLLKDTLIYCPERDYYWLVVEENAKSSEDSFDTNFIFIDSGYKVELSNRYNAKSTLEAINDNALEVINDGINSLTDNERDIFMCGDPDSVELLINILRERNNERN